MRRVGQRNQRPRRGAAVNLEGARRAGGWRAALMVGALWALGGMGAGGCDSPGSTVLPDAAVGDAADDAVGDAALDGGDASGLDAPASDQGEEDLPTLADTPAPDGLVTDGTALDEAGPDDTALDQTGADQTGPELPTPDAGGLGCTAESCPDGFGCVAKVCVARCEAGAALEDLVAALGPGITPVSQVCTDTGPVYAWDVLSSWEMLEVRAKDLSASSTSLALRKWPLFGQSGPAGAAILSASTVPGSVTLWEVFPSPLLTVDEDAGLALWGYTAAGAGATGAGATGAVFATPVQGGTTSTFPAVAPMGAVLRQGAALVSAQDVSGAGQGPGLYLLNLAGGLSTRLVVDLGSAPDAVASWQGQLLLGGYAEQWPDCGAAAPPTPGDRVVQTTEEALMASYGAGASVSAACDLPPLPLAADVRFLRDGRILERRSTNGWDTDALVMHTWTRDSSGAVSLGTSRVLSEGPLFRGARGMGDGGLIVLQHEAGYLVVQGPGAMADPGPTPQPDTVEEVEVVEEPTDAGSTEDAPEDGPSETVGAGSAEAGPVPANREGAGASRRQDFRRVRMFLAARAT